MYFYSPDGSMVFVNVPEWLCPLVNGNIVLTRSCTPYNWKRSVVVYRGVLQSCKGVAFSSVACNII